MFNSRFRALRRLRKEFENPPPHETNDPSPNRDHSRETTTSAPSTSTYWGNMLRNREAGNGTATASVKPTFPIFLLPTFRIPFRRRTTDSSAESCLSSSPEEGGGRDSNFTSAATSPAGSPPRSDTKSSSYFPPLADGTAPSRRIERTHPDTLRCSTCTADLAFGHQIISKGFTGRYGRAYLVAPAPPLSPSCPEQSELFASSPPTPARDLVNIRVGKSESRQLVTGWHTVADISCRVCHAKLGWKYVDAKEALQRYKVGKFILETERVVSFRSWEDVPLPGSPGGGALGAADGTRRTTSASPRGSMEGDETQVMDIVFDSDDEDECDDIFAGTWDRDVVAKRRSRKVAKKRVSSERAS